MAGVTLDQLPPALGLTGGELVWLYQQGPDQVTPWIGVRATVAQLAAYIINNQGLAGTGYASIRQLAAALASQENLVTMLDALTSDVTNQYNIAWSHASTISTTDPFVTGFLQPTLGLNNAQVLALFTLANTFPV